MSIKISILGDSISTLEGFSNNVVMNDDHDCYYPNSENDVTQLDETWWKEACRQLQGTLLINDAIGGTCVGYYNSTQDNYNHLGSNWCMNNSTRIEDLHGSSSTDYPDVIFVFGGTNDLCQNDFNQQTFANNYSNMINLIHTRYPNAKIVCITPYQCYLTSDHNPQITFDNLNTVCYWINHITTLYPNCYLCSLQDIHLSGNNTPPDADSHDHPNVKGMRIIADRVAFVCSLNGIGDYIYG